MSPAGLTPPASYASLPWRQIRVSHVPASSTTVTKVILVTLYRPGKHNSFTDTMAADMVHAFSLFDIDDRVKAVVVTGDGNMFCAGADLEVGLKVGEHAVREHRDSGGSTVLAIHRCRKPTIAAINGSAVGVGMTMTLPMSIRVVSAKAKVGFVFARRGIVMEACSSFFLPRLIGYSRALHLTTTGATFPASSPLLSDLFSEIVPSAEAVLPRAVELAQDIADNTSTVSTYLMREMMWRNPGSAESTHLLDSRILYDLLTKKDKEEGINAFLEKRPVNFTGTVDRDGPEAYPWWEPVDVSVKGSKL
ncbi:MAG: hypothetical protein M1832_003807 [Thelocarpon impressellum]|nr:MAG: hypothetical protein M1832_003807 [Thelocarpon impressellum]